jgi:hypothetical protein
MASTDADDKAGKDGAPGDGARHVYGPRAVSALVPSLVRPAFRKRSPAASQVMADWEAIVGPAVAAVSLPRKLFSGTLAIACAGPVALELQHLAEELMARINAHLGRITVTRLRFVQDAPPPMPPKAVRRPAVEAARRATATVDDPALREALERLGRSVLAPPLR